MSPAQHATESPTHRARFVVIAAILAVAVIAAGIVAVMHNHNGTAGADPVTPPAALTVLSTTPTGTNVAAGSSISVHFSTDLAPGSPMPTLSPPVAGAWSILSPSLLQYQATGPLVPGITETITVPGGSTGVVGSRGQHLAHTATSAFTVAQGSILRLQQLLAELGYLPLAFTPAEPVTSPAQEGNDQVGTFTWRWVNLANALTSQWTPGTANVITQGAVMNFESQHNIKVDGVAGPQVWSALLTALQEGQANALPYDYVLVNKALPETATVFRNGLPLYSTLANTGVASVATPDGTWPVYARYLVTTMSGTNPDGTKYVDPGIRWVSYFHGGDALHAFIRGSYGFPQSDGCVEMPPANAETVFPMTPLGTLVSVVG
jgi:peptidoglycan hydrolase-like protein with peptidoglycan-binding domain